MKTFALLLFFPALSALAQTAVTPQPVIVPSSASAASILQAARHLNGLGGEDLKPWHLKAHYESFGEKGAVVSSGTFEEWWVSPDRYKRSYTSAQFTQTEYRSPGGLFTTGANGSAPWPESLIADRVLAPLPSAGEVAESSPEKREHDFGGVPLVCVMLAQKVAGINQAPLSLFPSYCFSADKPLLRFSNYYGGVQSFFNKIGFFQQRYLGLDTTIKNGANDLLRVQIDQLTTLTETMTVGDLVQPAGDAVKRRSENVEVPSSVYRGKRIGGTDPTYPARAKQSRTTGEVDLKALISRDGHIYRLRVAKSPDPDLTLAAMAAVERWVFTPYLLDGEPVEVNTSIQVNFRLGP
jgi:TonB family protein